MVRRLGGTAAGAIDGDNIERTTKRIFFILLLIDRISTIYRVKPWMPIMSGMTERDFLTCC
jgi:hypothetical protein